MGAWIVKWISVWHLIMTTLDHDIDHILRSCYVSSYVYKWYLVPKIIPTNSIHMWSLINKHESQYHLMEYDNPMPKHNHCQLSRCEKLYIVHTWLLRVTKTLTCNFRKKNLFQAHVICSMQNCCIALLRKLQHCSLTSNDWLHENDLKNPSSALFATSCCCGESLNF